MTTLMTVTARGQVTFRKEVLRHLGVEPGDKISLDFLPDGRIVLEAVPHSGTLHEFIGMLAGRSSKVATLEEINDAASCPSTGRPFRC